MKKEKKTSVQVVLAVAAVVFWFIELKVIAGVFIGAAGALYLGEAKLSEWTETAKEKVLNLFGRGSSAEEAKA